MTLPPASGGLQRLSAPAAVLEAASSESVAEEAYVSLLHGDRPEFLIYALVLGSRLRYLDDTRPRILLVGNRLPGYSESFLDSNLACGCLQHIWNIKPIDLIHAPVADSTGSKRHRFVFSKLRALELPFERLVFLDLDTWLRRNPAELFSICSPAGMHHGSWSIDHEMAHGQPWPEEAYENGCPNAGLMRLDPPQNAHAEVAGMVDEVQAISEHDASALPEQYYLAQKLKQWRQTDTTWNVEVFQSVYVQLDESFQQWREPRFADLPMAWWMIGYCKKVLAEKVKMFHFSGVHLHPWWYLHLLEEDDAIQGVEEAIDFEFYARDGRGLIGLAVREWLEGVEAVRKEFAEAPTEMKGFIANTICSLAHQASYCRLSCPRCCRAVWELHDVPQWEDLADSSTCCEECVIKSAWEKCCERGETSQSYEKWLGRIDGDIPPKKRKEFKKDQKTLRSRDAGKDCAKSASRRA